MHGLLEAMLDLEAKAIETNDVDGIEGNIRAHQNASPSFGMVHDDEANEAADRTPQQVVDLVVDCDVFFSIDWACCAAH